MIDKRERERETETERVRVVQFELKNRAFLQMTSYRSQGKRLIANLRITYITHQCILTHIFEVYNTR